MPHHILVIRKVVQPTEDATGNLEGAVEASTDQEGAEVDVRRKPARDRRVSVWQREHQM